MEEKPEEKIALRRAISAHQEAEGALTDIIRDTPGAPFDQMLTRIKQNLEELRAAAEATSTET